MKLCKNCGETKPLEAFFKGNCKNKEKFVGALRYVEGSDFMQGAYN